MESVHASMPSADEDPLDAFHRIKMLSPSEMDFAFVAAAYRDRDDADKMEEWRTMTC